MAVIQSLQNLFNFSRVRPVTRAPLGVAPKPVAQQNTSLDTLRAQSQLQRLYKHLEKLADLMDVSTRFKLDLPDARSTTALGLDLTHTAAALNSSEEINASPMSFGAFGPEWNDGSSAAITIGGEYDGTHGTGTLNFEVIWDGTHGVDDLRIRLEDPQGKRIRNITIRDNHPENREYSLDNGLFLTLGPGALVDGDTTTIQVYDNLGAAVDPDNPLGGIRNSNPNLQFGLPAIANDSFQLNGANISVNTTDSINDVINRINLSNAGVTAAFNATTERLDFLQNTLGEQATIDLQNDNSNFLLAMKLDGAIVTPGIDPETIKSLESVGTFSAVQDGNIIINGREIAIDAENDTLTTMIEKINSSPANVVASFDSSTQKFLLEAQDASSTLEIDSNGTGFFAALNMVEGRVDPEAISSGISRRRSYDIADAFSDAFADINYLFDNSSFDDRGAQSADFRAPLEAAFKEIFGGENSGSAFGLRFDGSDEGRSFGRLADLDRRALTRDLQLRGGEVKAFLAGRDGNTGMIQSLLGATRQALASVNTALGISGSFIDIYA